MFVFSMIPACVRVVFLNLDFDLVRLLKRIAITDITKMLINIYFFRIKNEFELDEDTGCVFSSYLQSNSLFLCSASETSFVLKE